MGIGSFLFGSGPKSKRIDDPIFDEAADKARQPYKFFGAKNYYKGILNAGKAGDYSKLPGMAMFDNEISRAYGDIENQTTAPNVTGPLADRIMQLNKDRARDSINSQRFGFIQDSLSGAAGGLSGLSAAYNNYTLGQGQLLSGIGQGRNFIDPGRAGALGGILGAGAAAFGGPAGAAAGKKLFGG